MKNNSSDAPIIEAVGLHKRFRQRGKFLGGKVNDTIAVEGVNLLVEAGKSIGLVGESGSGKSTLSKCMAGLLSPTSGEVLYKGRSLYELSSRDKRNIQREMQLVFQNPYASLNPKMRIKDIVAEPLLLNTKKRGQSLNLRIEELLEKVGLGMNFVHRWPREMSGGQHQRVAIARALALDPKVLFLDEPTSALDVSVQAQILNLLTVLQKELGLTYIFVSHDLSVVRYICDHVAIMHRGRIIEIGQTSEIFSGAQHPYTQNLLTSMLTPDPNKDISEAKQSAVEFSKEWDGTLTSVTSTHYVAANVSDFGNVDSAKKY